MSDQIPTREQQEGALGALGEEIDESLHPLLQSLVDNIKFIVGAIVALILAVGGYAVFDAVQASKVAEAQERLLNITKQEDPAKRAEAIESFLSEAPSAMHAGIKLELASTLSDAGEHDRAAAIWKELAQSNVADMSIIAKSGLAAELSRTGDHKGAMDVLKGLTENAPSSYESMLLHRLAYEAEMAESWDVALSTWEKLLETNPSGNNGFIESKISSARAKAQG